MKIAIDVDDVLFEFNSGFIEWYNLINKTDFKLEDIKDYDHSKILGIAREEAIASIDRFFESPEFKRLKVCPGALEGVIKLAKEHKLIIVTSRPKGLREITVGLIEKHFPKIFEEIIFTGQYDGNGNTTKGQVCVEKKIDVIFEDNFSHAEECFSKGIKAILFDKPWNQVEISGGIQRVKNWEEAVDLVRKVSF